MKIVILDEKMIFYNKSEIETVNEFIKEGGYYIRDGEYSLYGNDKVANKELFPPIDGGARWVKIDRPPIIQSK